MSININKTIIHVTLSHIHGWISAVRRKVYQNVEIYQIWCCRVQNDIIKILYISLMSIELVCMYSILT